MHAVILINQISDKFYLDVCLIKKKSSYITHVLLQDET